MIEWEESEGRIRDLGQGGMMKEKRARKMRDLGRDKRGEKGKNETR